MRKFYMILLATALAWGISGGYTPTQAQQISFDSLEVDGKVQFFQQTSSLTRSKAHPGVEVSISTLSPVPAGITPADITASVQDRVSCSYTNQYTTTFSPAEPNFEFESQLNGDANGDYPDNWADAFGNSYPAITGISFNGPDYKSDFLNTVNTMGSAINGTTCGGAGSFSTQQFAAGDTPFEFFYTTTKRGWYEKKATQCAGINPMSLQPHTLIDTTLLPSYNCSANRSINVQLAKAGLNVSEFKGESHGIMGPITFTPTLDWAYWVNEFLTEVGTSFYFRDAGPGYGHLYHFTQTGSGYRTAFMVDTMTRSIAPNQGTYIYMYWSTNTATLLPVELIKFDAKKVGAIAHLDWATASEVNNLGYDIERSTDGIEFETIGFVEGKNRPANYQFEDHNPLVGLNLYRLVQKDFDGKETFSELRSVQFGRSQTVTASPNPTNSFVTFSSLLDSDDEDYTITITNASGRWVTTTTNMATIDLSAQPGGIYIATITTTTTRQNLRVMKN